MSYYVSPENWEEPVKTKREPLTASQRAGLKTVLKNHVNSANKKVSVKELVSVAIRHTNATYGKLVEDKLVEEISREIQNEWHPKEIELEEPKKLDKK